MNQEQSPTVFKYNGPGNKAAGPRTEFFPDPPLPPTVFHIPVSCRRGMKRRQMKNESRIKLYQKHMLSLASSYWSAALLALDACLSPVTWQHCHGNQVWVIICAMTPILQWRWEEGKEMEKLSGGWGGWNESRGRREAAGTQTEAKN